eukprot:TRINITY_DN106394_c0_g1_i1.p1 TRINITY_DN106394_c0_g1~~TRINITY_DN106394_c0_g1_i1.p1  ORF type:complete len:116 (-),score=22.38 TRINITY_DN106394_c0_g1_i1:101-448(-)
MAALRTLHLITRRCHSAKSIADGEMPNLRQLRRISTEMPWATGRGQSLWQKRHAAAVVAVLGVPAAVIIQKRAHSTAKSVSELQDKHLRVDLSGRKALVVGGTDGIGRAPGIKLA